MPSHQKPWGPRETPSPGRLPAPSRVLPSLLAPSLWHFESPKLLFLASPPRHTSNFPAGPLHPRGGQALLNSTLPPVRSMLLRCSDRSFRQANDPYGKSSMTDLGHVI